MQNDALRLDAARDALLQAKKEYQASLQDLRADVRREKDAVTDLLHRLDQVKQDQVLVVQAEQDRIKALKEQEALLLQQQAVGNTVCDHDILLIV